ncbi:methyltransferase domain-containing protein [Psychromicrobium xiongbiense]|uniref:methyltransferase domain-containing protein n=1 Tax=Psychromicrobium xiongbiense TaxID=3051184 RepID=UPI002552874C|nr:methyltransferase domain-containing protein [Psychromicrobium sp. YIM S02556]
MTLDALLSPPRAAKQPGSFDLLRQVPRSATAGLADFGTGGTHPYEEALVRGQGALRLVDAAGVIPEVHFRVERWLASANRLERGLLKAMRGPVLDIGCGPGRMVAAASALGLPALGLDSSTAAAARARARGACVLVQSVFDPLPDLLEGPHQRGLLLLDGNIGIGGDPHRLFRRARALSAPGATLLVETDPVRHIATRYQATVHGPGGTMSEPFPWARLGLRALPQIAATAGWSMESSFSRRGREFAVLRTAWSS